MQRSSVALLLLVQLQEVSQSAALAQGLITKGGYLVLAAPSP